MSHVNIIICGVGGTGVIGLGELLRKAAMLEGNRVLGTESRGRAKEAVQPLPPSDLLPRVATRNTTIVQHYGQALLGPAALT